MRTLDCKRMAHMVPLYIADDLGGAPEREVVAHLAQCEGCSLIAEEFSERRSLLIQACARPEFNAEFCAGLRRGVTAQFTYQMRQPTSTTRSPMARMLWIRRL